MAKKKEDVVGMDWDLVVKGMGKKFGKGLSLFEMDDSAVQMLAVEPIPSYLAELDNALGIFGLGRGRVIELYGPNASAKTSLALHMVAMAQMQFPEKPVLFADLEHSLDLGWSRNLGVKDKGFWVTQPDSGEQATQIINMAAASGQPSLIVLDSVAAITPQAEIDGEMTDHQMGKVGAIMGKFLRKTTPILRKNGVTLLCLNQIRSKLGPISGEERPGGQALKFYASQVMRTRKSADIVAGGEVIGIEAELTLKKNKLAPPFRKGIIPLFFRGGFSKEYAVLKACAEEGIVQKKGTWYSYNNDSLGQGIVNATGNITEKLFQELYDKYKSSRLKDAVFLDEAKDDKSEKETKDAV